MAAVSHRLFARTARTRRVRARALQAATARTLEALETRVLLTSTWTSLGSGDWNVAGNWSGTQVPTAADDVVISSSGITVTVSDTRAAHSIQLSAGASLKVTGDLTLSTNSTFDGGVSLEGGTLQLEGGSFTLNGGASLTSGKINFRGSTIINNGTMTIAGSGVLYASWGPNNLGGTLDNKGAIQQAGSMTLYDSVVIKNESLYDFTADGALLAFGNFSSMLQNAADVVDRVGPGRRAAHGQLVCSEDRQRGGDLH